MAAIRRFATLARAEADEEQLQYRLQHKVGVVIAIKRQQDYERNDVCEIKFYYDILKL